MRKNTEGLSVPSSPVLAQLIGEVVIAAAWAEDAGGTLLQVLSCDLDARAKGYDDSGSGLVKALKPHVPADLIERFDAALRLRHFVVHGIFVVGSFANDPSTVWSGNVCSLKRSRRTEKPEREVKVLSADSLRQLAQQFWEIEEELERLHSEAIFGRKVEETV